MKHLAFLLATSLLLAGCLDDGPDEDADPTDGGDTEPQRFEETFEGRGSLQTGTSTPSLDEPGSLECGVAPGGSAQHVWEVPGQINGTAVRIVNLQITIEFDGAASDLDLEVIGPNGAIVGSSTAFNPQTGSNSESVTLNNAEPGAYTSTVTHCAGAPADYTITGTADLIEVQSETVEISEQDPEEEA